MKNKNMIIVTVSVIAMSALGLAILTSNDDNSNNQNTQSQEISDDQTKLETVQSSPEDNQLMRFVEKDSIEYKNALSFQGDEYDQYFIANMIHYSEGLAQIESLAINSANPAISEGAADRAKQAEEDTDMYKKLQIDMGQPTSYGDAMQYHAAMGADAEVYFATSSLEGLSGAEFETKLSEQLVYFRRAETLLSGAGLINAANQQVKKLVNETLATNAAFLERIQS